MRLISREYFHKAVEGHRRALTNLTEETIEQVFMTSVLVSFYALFTLNESENEKHTPCGSKLENTLQWLQLAKGSRMIGGKWYEMVGSSWRIQSGIFYGQPDLTDSCDLFDPRHCKPFEALLVWSPDGEGMTAEDRSVCQQVLSYVSLIYSGIVNAVDDPLTTSRRFVAMPSRCPPEFVALVERRAPRAMVILAHFFAMMRMLDIPWYYGIAECQIPAILDELPFENGWRDLMRWPITMIRTHTETAIDPITAQQIRSAFVT